MRNALVNVRGWMALLLPALVPVAALAEPLILQAPAETAPNQAPPPAQGPLDPRLNNAKILVMPFQPVNPADTANAWIGRSVQESLVADLTVVAPTRVESTNEVAANTDEAIVSGRKHGVRFVVTGGFVTADRELRITGQLLDVELGKAIGGLKVTGEPSQIFRMEDGLAMQVRAQLMPGQELPPAPQGQQPPQQQPPQQQPQPLPPVGELPPAPDANGVRTDEGQLPLYTPYAIAPTPPIYGADTYYPYTDNSYSYPYAYPYADYGYGYGDYPFGLGLGYYYGGSFHPYFRHNYGYRGYAGYGRSGYGGISGFSTLRSPSIIRGGSSFRSAATFRSPSVFSHGSSLGGFHGGASFHSFGGGGSFHGGGGSHGGGGHGGHR